MEMAYDTIWYTATGYKKLQGCSVKEEFSAGLTVFIIQDFLIRQLLYCNATAHISIYLSIMK